MFEKCILAVIDTAAQISMISTKFYEESAGPQRPPGRALRIGNAQASSYMQCTYVEGLEVKIGSTVHTHNWAVGPISDNAILGLDFLLDRDAVIDLKLGTVCLNGITTSAELLRGRNGATRRVCNAVVAQATTIPAFSVHLVSVGLSSPNGSQFMTNPALLSDLMVTPSLLDGESLENYVEVINDSSHSVSLSPGRILSSASEVDSILDEPPVMIDR